MKFLLRILQPRREQPSRRQQLDIFDTVGNAARVVDDHPMRFLFAQIGKLRQHLIRGLEVNGQGCVGVGKLLAGQQDMAVYLVLRLLEVHITGGAHGLAQLPVQPDDSTVELPQFLL